MFVFLYACSPSLEEYRSLSVEFSYVSNDIQHEGEWSATYTGNSLSSDRASGYYTEDDGSEVQWETVVTMNENGMWSSWELFENGESSFRCEDYQWEDYLLMSQTCSGISLGFGEDIAQQVRTFTYNENRQTVTDHRETYWSNGNVYLVETKDYYLLEHFLFGSEALYMRSSEEYSEDGTLLDRETYTFENDLPSSLSLEATAETTEIIEYSFQWTEEGESITMEMYSEPGLQGYVSDRRVFSINEEGLVEEFQIDLLDSNGARIRQQHYLYTHVAHPLENNVRGGSLYSRSLDETGNVSREYWDHGVWDDQVKTMYLYSPDGEQLGYHTTTHERVRLD